MKQHIYFVSIAHNGTGNDALGFGYFEIRRSEPIIMLAQLNKIAEDIGKTMGLANVVILNYQILRIERE